MKALQEAILALAFENPVSTVRQLYYGLVVRGVVPKDECRGYRAVQRQVLALRREGRLPWSRIADATRFQRKPASFDSAPDAVADIARSYRRNLWQGQGVLLEVWVEKDALAGVVMEATEPWDVPLMVSRGTSSETYIYEAAKYAEDAHRAKGVETVVFALYDLDAAGRRAARSVERGLREHASETPIRFQLLAVRPDQVQEWNLPTRPAKASDPEAHKFDGPAVELDAIPPDRLIALVNGAIEAHVDAHAWAIEREIELSERELLRRMAEEWLA